MTKLTINNHKHIYFTNEDDQQECKKCGLLKSTIEYKRRLPEDDILARQSVKPKMPKVSIYITPKELDNVIKMTKMISSIADKNEKIIEIRVEGRINYHDLIKIIKNAKKYDQAT